MLFFSKKPTPTSPPYEEVQRMTAKGIGDKDIIKHLKGKGYSYEQIEKAMLQAVKGGVEESQPPAPMAQQPASNASFDEFYSQSYPGQSQDVFTQSAAPPLPDFSDVDELRDSDAEPEAMIEELIEGVVEDKWKRFDDRMRKFEDDLSKVRSEMRNSTLRFESLADRDPSKEQDARLQELAEQMDDLDARVGGLEKAFKQFLPSLTRNIESLSTVIHELKNKHDMEPEHPRSSVSF